MFCNTGLPYLSRWEGRSPRRLLPLHQRNYFQPERICLRLVVQRELPRSPAALQAEPGSDEKPVRAKTQTRGETSIRPVLIMQHLNKHSDNSSVPFLEKPLQVLISAVTQKAVTVREGPWGNDLCNHFHCRRECVSRASVPRSLRRSNKGERFVYPFYWLFRGKNHALLSVTVKFVELPDVRRQIGEYLKTGVLQELSGFPWSHLFSCESTVVPFPLLLVVPYQLQRTVRDYRKAGVQRGERFKLRRFANEVGRICDVWSVVTTSGIHESVVHWRNDDLTQEFFESTEDP